MAPEESTPRPIEGLDVRPSRGGMFSSLAHRDFRYLVTGTTMASMGHWAQVVGKGWLVFQLTESPFHLGLVTFAQGIPMFLVAPIAGGLADRFDRLKMIWASQVLMILLAVSLAMLVLTDAITLWQVYLIAVISGVLFGINTPPRQAIVFDLVGREDLPNAVALNAAGSNTTRVLGPSLGAVFIGTVGLEGAFFLQAGSYIVAAWTLMMMRGGSRPAPRREAAPFYRSLVDGMSYARRDRTVRMLLVVALAAAVLGWPALQLLPAYAGDVLDLGGAGYALLMTANGIGALVGAVAVVTMGGFLRRKGPALLGTLILAGVTLIVMGASDALALIFLIVFAYGATNAMQMTLNNTLVQLAVEDQYRGRATALYLQTFGLMPLGSLAAGAIAEAVGLQATFVGLGAIMVVLMVWIWATSSSIRRL